MSRTKFLRQSVRVLCVSCWAAALIAGSAAYLYSPATFSAANVASFIARFDSGLWIAFFLISSLRGITLLPSTPFVIAGTILFPSHPWLVLAVSMAGIVCSSTIIYFFADRLGLHEYFEKHHADRIHAIKERLERPAGFVFIASWAFLPVVPTDLVCYTAGIVEMNYWKFILAIVAGESILSCIYIFLGSGIISQM